MRKAATVLAALALAACRGQVVTGGDGEPDAEGPVADAGSTLDAAMWTPAETRGATLTMAAHRT
jgi:hypothetical protein